MAASCIMSSQEENNLAVSVPNRYGQQIRECLQRSCLYDPERRSKSSEDGRVLLPILNQVQDLERRIREVMSSENLMDWNIVHNTLPSSKKKQIVSQYQEMVSVLEEFLRRHDVVLTDKLRSNIPKRWERHGDLVMFDASFQDPVWKKYGKEIWPLIATVLSCKRIAQKGSIASNGYRTPQVCLLLGQDGWVEHVDNGVRYTYDVTKCMFSSGNVTEKLRVSCFHCESETVVDLYAGIGYFTLPYLLHAKAQLVHACEWNPDAAEALKRNLRLNGVEDRCVVHLGDNRELCPKAIADRVNLGLIPSSESGWETACAALKKCSGGILHIHGNVETRKTKDKQGHDSHCENCSNSHTENDVNDSTKESHEKSAKNVCSNNVPMCINCFIVKNDAKCLDSSSTKTINKVTAKKSWKDWSVEVSTNIRGILERIHAPEKWRTNVLHIEHVKSYAPHVDHVVVDLDCRPVLNT